jgi:TRAP-type mannitol/chloroaromatic compound transport system substrate-binding protein
MKKKIRAILFAVLSLAVISMFTTLECNAADKVINWKYNSLWPSGLALYQGDKYFCDTVNKLSGGRLIIKLYPAGQLLPAYQNLDAVKKGTVQCAGDFGPYWSGKNTAFDLLGTTPMGMTWVDYMLWIYHDGGQKIYDDLYGKYDAKWILQNFTPIEAGFHTHVPINKVEDFKGLKLRMGSLFGQKILKELGASPTLLDSSEIYESVARKVVDGAEFSVPTVDWTVGFQKITKYWAAPAWYQTAIVLGVMINKNAWASLPDDLKEVVEQAGRATTAYMSSWFAHGNIKATHDFINAGTVMTHLDDKSMEELTVLINKVLSEEAKKNPDFAMVLKSQINYMKRFAAVRSYEAPYTFGFNPKSYPSVP